MKTANQTASEKEKHRFLVPGWGLVALGSQLASQATLHDTQQALLTWTKAKVNNAHEHV